MRKIGKTNGKMVRVIKDSRDASKDYWLDRHEAIQLFRQNKLDLVDEPGNETVFIERGK